MQEPSPVPQNAAIPGPASDHRKPSRHSRDSLKLLSFNIQVGINTQAYHHYVTRSWQHLLPHRQRNRTLDEIAQILRQYDLVALQEVDGGSLRSGFVNQVEFWHSPDSSSTGTSSAIATLASWHSTATVYSAELSRASWKTIHCRD